MTWDQDARDFLFDRASDLRFAAHPRVDEDSPPATWSMTVADPEARLWTWNITAGDGSTVATGLSTWDAGLVSQFDPVRALQLAHAVEDIAGCVDVPAPVIEGLCDVWSRHKDHPGPAPRLRSVPPPRVRVPETRRAAVVTSVALALVVVGYVLAWVTLGLPWWLVVAPPVVACVVVAAAVVEGRRPHPEETDRLVDVFRGVV